MPGQPIRRALPWWAGAHAMPIVALVILSLGVAAGAAAARLQPRPWSSSSSVLVGVPVTGSQDQSVRASQLVNMDTEVQVVLSREVLDAATELLEARPGALSGDVSATVPVGTQVVEVTAEATTPEQAQRRASAVTRAYLTLRQTQAEQALEQQRGTAQRRVEELTDQLRLARAELTETTEGTTDRLLLDTQIEALSTVLTQERTRLYTLEGSAPTPGSLLGEPTQAVRGGFGPALLVAVGALLGLVGALLLTWLALALARTVRSAPQVAALGVPTRRLGSRSDGPIPLSGPAVLRRRLDEGATVHVATVQPGAPPHAVASRVAAALELPDGTPGAVVGSSSPLAVDVPYRDGDLLVLLAASGTPVSEVEQAIEVAARTGTEVVAVLVTDRAGAAAADAGAQTAPSAPTAPASADEPGPAPARDVVHGPAVDDAGDRPAAADAVDVPRPGAQPARRFVAADFGGRNT